MSGADDASHHLEEQALPAETQAFLFRWSQRFSSTLRIFSPHLLPAIIYRFS